MERCERKRCNEWLGLGEEKVIKVEKLRKSGMERGERKRGNGRRDGIKERRKGKDGEARRRVRKRRMERMKGRVRNIKERREM